MNPKRPESDEQFLAYLTTLNPKCEDHPPGFDFRAATHEARELYARLKAELGTELEFDGDGAVQDASYHAGIIIPPQSQVLLSNFGQLATITEADKPLPAATVARIEQILEEQGYIYVPARLFGEPFKSRERHDGDLFNQLFDYL